MKRFLAALSVLLATSAPLAAQQLPQQQQPPRKTPQQITLEKLRAMGQERPDTSALPDSVRARLRRERADSIAALPRAAPSTPAPVDLLRDSIMMALARLPGFSSTEYKAISARFNVDTGVLVLRAKPDSQAAVLQGGQTMVVDSLLTYDRERAVACGFGKPILSGEGADAPVQSDRMCYNVRSKVGTAIGATTRINQDGNWIVAGDLTTDDTDVYIDHGRFTDCTLEEPHYHFSAGKVKVVNKDVLVARNVTLNFGDVPVFWLPFLMQSMKQGRRSGLLMPEFSINDIVRRSSRYNRRITNLGFYWATSEYIGTKLSFGWFADNWTQLNGALDYRITDKFLNGALTWNEYWPAGGGRQRTIAANNNWQPNERTSLYANVGYASSSQFVKQSTFDPRELNRKIDSNASVNRRFDWGSISLGGSRSQYLADDKVELAAPSLGVNISSITLFPATGTERFYNNATWTGSASTSYRRSTINPFLTPTGFGRDDVGAQANSSFTMRQFSWNQSFNVQRATQHERRTGLDVNGDSIAFSPERLTQVMNWSTGLSYQQRLIGTSTLTPGISLRGDAARDSVTGVMVRAPARMDLNATLKVDLFGLFPGIGPLERIRHRLSPSFSYSYSPAVAPDSLQSRVFGPTQIQEQNRISIGLSQTFEGKYRWKPPEGDSAAAVRDTTQNDPDQPRRIPQAPRVMLLALNTDAVVYDFVEARNGYGVQTAQISNSINSDLLRGLQFSVTHDLFRELPLADGAPLGTRQKREFAPHLSSVSTSFSLTGSSWLFRVLGLSGGPEAPPATGSTPTPVPEQVQPGPETVGAAGPSNLGLMGPREGAPVGQTPRGPVGSWNASFNYTMFRVRDEEAAGQSNQMVTANLMFQPTENWNVSWRTGYSFTQKQFTDHVLTLTRAMHDWDANFDFVKAQNGNFSFQFRVALRANPDLKFDYEQRDNSRRQFSSSR